MVYRLEAEEYLKIVDWIQEVDKDFFPWPWSSKSWSEINFENHSLYLIEKNNKHLGFALFQSLNGDDSCHLLKILILPVFRGLGYGSQLLKECLQKENSLGKKSCYLEVERGNSGAIGLYERLGFKKVREVEGFYKNGNDALCYLLSEIKS